VSNDSRIQAVTTGQPNVTLLACNRCGVLVWDFDKHFAHAHPAADEQEPSQ